MSSISKRRGPCELCQRETLLTEHHLIPRAVHRKKQFQRKFDKEEMRHRKLLVCRKCHKGIHRIIPDEKELARDYNTKEALLENERIVKHVKWVAKQPVRGARHK